MVGSYRRRASSKLRSSRAGAPEALLCRQNFRVRLSPSHSSCSFVWLVKCSFAPSGSRPTGHTSMSLYRNCADGSRDNESNGPQSSPFRLSSQGAAGPARSCSVRLTTQCCCTHGRTHPLVTKGIISELLLEGAHICRARQLEVHEADPLIPKLYLAFDFLPHRAGESAVLALLVLHAPAGGVLLSLQREASCIVAQRLYC